MDASAIDLAKILPAFMAAQSDDVAFADALSAVIRLRAKRCEQIGIWDAISGMDEAVLDYAAEALGIAWWRGDWSLSEKREMLGMAEQIRCGVNSHWALETLLKKWFGDPDLKVEEWFDYGGKPYTFRILTNEAAVQRQLQFAKVVDALKRTSQSMDGIFVGFSMRGRVFIGAKGSDSRTERGEAVNFAYLPKGTVLGDGIYGGFERIVMEASGVSEDIADAYVEAVSDGDSTLESDAPLVISAGGAPLPATHERRERLDAAVARWWSGIGVEQAAPSIAYAWPPPAPTPAADLLTGLDIHLSLGTSTTFDGSDSSGNGHSFANGYGWAGFMQVIADGKFGSAVRGNNDSRLQSSQNDWHSIFPCGSSKDWSISAWVRTTSTTENTNGHLCGARVYNPRSVKGTRTPVLTGGKIVLLNTSLESGFVADGQWHHVAATHSVESAKCSLWVDGVLVGDAADGEWDDVPWPSAGETIKVGSRGNGGIIGDIDEVSVWGNRAIGQAEVTALFAGGAGLPFEEWT